MCIIDGNIDCIIDPISNAIYNTIYPYISWVIDLFYAIGAFISDTYALGSTITSLLTGLLYDSFLANQYSATVFALILSGISLVLFMRIYNLLAGIEIMGFKLPKL